MILSCCNVHHLAPSCTILYSESLEFIYFQRFYNLSILRFWIKMTKPRRSSFFYFTSSQNVEVVYNVHTDLHEEEADAGGGVVVHVHRDAGSSYQDKHGHGDACQEPDGLLLCSPSNSLLICCCTDTMTAAQQYSTRTHTPTRLKDPVQHYTSARVVSLFLEEY